jgi:tetratricopeptide (TPR) repeat protein
MRLAETQKKLGKKGAAAAAYKSAIKADPKLATAYYNLGNLYLEGEDFAEAQDAFTEAVKLEPNNVKAHFNLAIALHSQGELEKALAEYQKVIQVGSGQKGSSATVKQAQDVIPALKTQIEAGK